jgi:PD-(D/E)XK nuclease superfamily protein
MNLLPHISYSQYNTYSKCPRSWYLGKLKSGEERQTWYIPIGSAVHDMIEDHLSPNAALLPAKDYFYPLVRKQLFIEPDTTKWLAGGPKSDPVTEGKALKRVEECFEKALTFLEDIDVWEVEYDATGRLPNLEVPVKAFVDIVGEHKKKGPVIVDWKTGSTKPGNFQLETYAALLSSTKFAALVHRGGPWHGRYAMLSPNYTSDTRFVDLSQVDPAAVGMKYQHVYNKMKQKLYPTNHGFDCNFCFQQDNCALNAGPSARTRYYDRAHEDGLPF